MSGTRIDLTVKKGASFVYTFRLLDKDNQPRDLNTYDYDLNMQIRSHPNSSVTLASLTTDNGGIVKGNTEDTQGMIMLFMSPTQTKTLGDAYTSAAVYDVHLVGPMYTPLGTLGSSSVEKVLSGVVLIEPEVTK